MTFSDFYQLYPRHVGRAAAEKAWRKLNPDAALQERIQAALEWQRPMMLKREPEYRPYPATWLNQERWTDEPDIPQQVEPTPQEKAGAYFASELRQGRESITRTGRPTLRIVGGSHEAADEPESDLPF